MLPSRWLVNLNRDIFHYSGPSEDPVSYARWEFSEGKKIWQRFFADRVSVEAKDILDLGSGPGGKTCYMTTLDANRVIGVDNVARLVREAEMARVYLVPPEKATNLEFVCVDASDLPFPDRYFDVVTCSDAFEHFPEPEKVLSEGVRVLKKGGLFTIDFAQWASYNGHHLGDFFRTPWCHVLWDEDAVIEAVRKLAEIEKARHTDPEITSEIDNLVERRIDQFKNGLNHITVSSFDNILENQDGLKTVMLKRTAAYPGIRPFIYIPGLRELAIARNVYILERV